MSFNIYNSDTETLTYTKESVQTVQEHELVLFNDDVNTFDWVIDCLIDVCDHDTEQAQQCAMIVHYRGKCGVKTGELNPLKKMCTSLLERGLSAEVI